MNDFHGYLRQNNFNDVFSVAMVEDLPEIFFDPLTRSPETNLEST
jgi:hypothetical protein